MTGSRPSGSTRGPAGRSSGFSPAPPSSTDRALIARLREDLTAARFTNEQVAQLLGTAGVAALDREQIVPAQLPILEHLTQTPVENLDPCAVLSGLWLAAVDVTADQLAAALPRTGVEELRGLGLIRLEETAETVFCRPTVDLRPYQVEQRSGGADLWVVSDLSAHQVTGPLPTDHVLGIGQASLTLASATHRRRVGRALDLGTGCGIQLFHLLDHADSVVGTDLSARALAFTRFNLMLNAAALGLDPENLHERVELREGTLFEPVAGERFELVVSNPPFVITPRGEASEHSSSRDDGRAPNDERYTYRDGGRRGDELMEELITGLPDVLDENGTAQLLGNWEIPAQPARPAPTESSQTPPADQPDVDPFLRPRHWVETAGLDAWFLQRDRQDPSGYAETWLRDASEERDLAEFRRRYAGYLEDFASRNVAGVGFGMIWLRRPPRPVDDAGRPGRGQDEAEQPDGHGRDGPTLWQRFEELTGALQQPLGPVIGQTSERAVALTADPEAESAVDSTVLQVAEDVTEGRHQRFGAPHPEVILARQGAGLRRVRAVSSAAAGFLGAADGEFAAGQLITAVVALLDDGETDLKALEASLRREVLQLYIDGFLTVVDP